MVRGVLVLCWLAAGCNVVLGLDDTRHYVAPDTDGDGVADPDDDCPGTPDPEQRDLDGDGVGDLCDNCPLVANAAQRGSPDDSEPDGIGDECDSHPMNKGDCLIALDSFADPASLGSHWQIVPPSAAGELTAADEGIQIANVPGGAPVALLARDLGGTPLGDTFDVQVMLSATLTVDSLSGAVASSNYSAGTPQGYYCGVISKEHPLVSGGYYGQPPLTASLSLDPQNDRVLLRLITTTPAATPFMRCRVDYGGTVGALTQAATMPPAGGAPGVVITPDPVNPITIKAIALYHYDPAATSCPPTIYY